MRSKKLVLMLAAAALILAPAASTDAWSCDKHKTAKAAVAANGEAKQGCSKAAKAALAANGEAKQGCSKAAKAALAAKGEAKQGCPKAAKAALAAKGEAKSGCSKAAKAQLTADKRGAESEKTVEVAANGATATADDPCAGCDDDDCSMPCCVAARKAETTDEAAIPASSF